MSEEQQNHQILYEALQQYIREMRRRGKMFKADRAKHLLNKLRK